MRRSSDTVGGWTRAGEAAGLLLVLGLLVAGMAMALRGPVGKGAADEEEAVVRRPGQTPTVEATAEVQRRLRAPGHRRGAGRGPMGRHRPPTGRRRLARGGGRAVPRGDDSARDRREVAHGR